MPFFIEDPDDPLRYLCDVELFALVAAEGKWIAGQNPDMQTEELRAVGLQRGEGAYARMLRRFPHLEYELDEKFDEGTNWMSDQEARLCSGCHLALGPEWWICPSCERWWLDDQDRPNWPVYQCGHCASWQPHEVLWCQQCMLIREPDPRHVETELRGPVGEGQVEYIPSQAGQIVGEPLRRRTPLEIEADRIGPVSYTHLTLPTTPYV